MMKHSLMSIPLFCFIICAAADFTPENPPKVLVTHWDVPEAGLKILRMKCNVTLCEGRPAPSRAEILEKVIGMDGVLWVNHNTLNAEALDTAGPQLKSISTMSAGLDFVDIDEVKRRNIPLGYTSTILTGAVADTAIGLMISASRRFHEGRMKILNSQWEQRPQFLLGQDSKGSIVGIVGFGKIGETIAKRLQGFEVQKIIYSGHSRKPYADKYGAEFVTFDELLAKSDYVFLSAPITNETRGMFNAAAFNKMKPTSVFINIARGSMVDQDALYDCLKNNKIFAAGIDVMVPEPLPSDHKLLSLSNLIVLPHLGSAAVGTRDDASVIAAHNVLRGIAGEPMLSPVP